MKILHIGKYYPPFSGGIENFMGDLLPLLVESSNQSANHICALVHNHSFSLGVHEETINNVRVVRVPSYGRLLYAPVSPAFAYYLRRELKHFKPDIIHIHMPNTSAFWLLFSSLAKKIPWVIHWHSDVVSTSLSKLFALAYQVYSSFEQQLLKQSRQIIVTSPNYLHSSMALKNCSDKTQIIPLGMTEQQLPVSDRSLQNAAQLWGKDSFRVLSIGRLTYYKGHQYLIQAMPGLPGCQLIIVGQGEEQNALQKLIKRLKLENNVTLSGKVSAEMLHALLKSCDLFCLPSIERTEAFGLVLLEAMYYAKPTLVSNIPGSGMTWVCQDRQTGLLAIPCNSEDIQRKIVYLKDHPSLIETWGKNGKQRLDAQFRIEKLAQNTLNLYHRILQ
jgi:rhamnosyl/mannosyltransferase